MDVLENITLMYVLCHSMYINVIFLCEWPNCVDVPAVKELVTLSLTGPLQAMIKTPGLRTMMMRSRVTGSRVVGGRIV